MNNMVTIGDQWFNLDQISIVNKMISSEHGVYLSLSLTSGRRPLLYDPAATALWDHMKKHSYNIVLEEKE